MILARLKIADRKYVGAAHAEVLLQVPLCHAAIDGTKLGRHRIGNHVNAIFRNAVMLQNRFARKLARGQDGVGALDCIGNREAQLISAKKRKILRMFQVTHIVYGRHQFGTNR